MSDAESVPNGIPNPLSLPDGEGITVHTTVLLNEAVEGLAPKEGGVYLDGTLGGGGHTIALACRVGPAGLVIGCDRDRRALDRTQARMERAGRKLPIRMAQANFADFPEVLAMLDIEKVDGFLLDLGLSSDQLADRQRGFSFDSDGQLDLRFDTSEGIPARELLARASEEQIANIIFSYGEERFSRRIARHIVRLRNEGKAIRKASERAALCRQVIPGHNQQIDPATRTFQALRIAVNEELKSLETFLGKAADFLRPDGRIAVISFHSLEDRIVKNALRDDTRLEVLTKKPITAGDEERTRNPRSRSAKLRIAARC